jgi:MOSC domain-containing protein YiiM
MIEKIFISKEKGQPQVEVDEVMLIADKGIVGDRNFDKAEWPGQNITFVEAEAIENFNATYGRTIQLSDTRRNVVTRGVRLNDLVGKYFQIGNTQFYGVKLCDPCTVLGGLLETDSMSVRDVVKAWAQKGGLRADILTHGVLRVGMHFT